MRDVVIDWGERLLLLTLFAAFAVANIRTGDWVNWTLVGLEGLTAFFVLIRRKALSVTEIPLDWALAISASMLPLLARPEDTLTSGLLSGSFVVVGTMISVGAKLSLNRRFGMAPANRGVQANWIYRVVRHPMYLGYIVCQLGYLMHNPTIRNFCVFSLAWLLQIARLSREERHLMLDPEYRAYASRTRFRLFPGIF